MAKETIGYVKLEWTCPKCSSRNPGPEKTCLSCGAPQPENVQFEQASSGVEATQDETLKKIAQTGADIHCAFCGTRNPAGTAVCSQCGADLKEGKRRETGKVVGAYQPLPVKQIACPNCAIENPETAFKCSNCGAPLKKIEAPIFTAVDAKPTRPNWLIFFAAAIIIGLCILAVIGLFTLSSPRASKTATVQNVDWQTSVAIEQLGPVRYQGWQDQIPQDAQILGCRDQVQSIQDVEPSSGNYMKSCGTPYTVDTGSGVGQVVQDCQFEILAPYCEYTIEQWRVVDQFNQSGEGLSPIWAEPTLNSNQRLGDKTASYVVNFETGNDQYQYPVRNLEELEKFQLGSQWILKLNALNQIVAVESTK